MIKYKEFSTTIRIKQIDKRHWINWGKSKMQGFFLSSTDAAVESYIRDVKSFRAVEVFYKKKKTDRMGKVRHQNVLLSFLVFRCNS